MSVTIVTSSQAEKQQTDVNVNVKIETARLSPLKSGIMLTDGTEQTLLEFLGVGTVCGYVDLENMQGGDTIIIRQYMKLTESEPYKKYAEEQFVGHQHPPILYIKPKETDVAIKITLQQTAGTFRRFPYNFMKES